MNTAASSPSVVPFCFNDQLVRTTIINDDPWFVAKDICSVLERQWNGATTLEFLDDDEKGVYKFDTPSGEQELLIVSESGLYTLIIRSNKPQAKQFRKWVTAEVLPSIRKTGSYQTPDGDRRVFVNHSHRKTSSGPNGLDIRYTLDLGKIVANPTRRGVELLERLTGIQLSDIPLSEQEGEESVEIVKTFLAERCRFNPGSQVPFSSVYAAYRRHCGASGDIQPGQVVSRKRMSILMSAAGYSSQKIGGSVRLIDTVLVDGGEVMA
jgi:hypothetical protein